MIYNLFKAMRLMTRNHNQVQGENQEPMSKYIGRRVLLSALIIIVLLIGIATGLIIPNANPLQ
jgi:hypothetical protein